MNRRRRTALITEGAPFREMRASENKSSGDSISDSSATRSTTDRSSGGEPEASEVSTALEMCRYLKSGANLAVDRCPCRTVYIVIVAFERVASKCPVA